MDILEPKKSLKSKSKQSTKMKMSKVGNQTNSQDPQAVNSRVFVGNLNTFQCSKTDVERMFQRYGRLAGISMHKGYAFVQFTNPFDARSACLGEDGRTVLSQILDVNMVAEPKPHQTGRKRQNVAKTGNDWDYYYDSYYASSSMAIGPHRVAPPIKRQRLMSSGRNKTKEVQKNTVISTFDQLKTYSNPDILICGNCREMFTELSELLEHKKTYCKLRFTCKCDTYGSNDKCKINGDEPPSAALLCVQCKDVFHNAWDLMVHAQAAHMVNIYELGVPSLDTCTSPDSFIENNIQDKDNTAGIILNGDLDNENDENGDIEQDSEFLENGNHQHIESPDSSHSRNEKDLDEVMDIETNVENCIRHALSVVTTPASQPGSSPPPLAATAPLANEWKTENHTRLAPEVGSTPY